MDGLIKEVLNCCDEFDLNIKLHCDQSRRLSHCLPLDTHYIMRGEKIIASLNESSVSSWVVRKSEQARKIKGLLNSDGIKLSDYEKCKKSLMETVSPKANFKIYEDFLA